MSGFTFYAEPVQVGRYQVGVGERETPVGNDASAVIVLASRSGLLEFTEEECRALLTMFPGLIEAVAS